MTTGALAAASLGQVIAALAELIAEAPNGKHLPSADAKALGEYLGDWRFIAYDQVAATAWSNPRRSGFGEWGRIEYSGRCAWGIATQYGFVVPPDALVMVAAADHCLAAAYAGYVAGVRPDDLLQWRLADPSSPHSREPDGLGGTRTVDPEVVHERAELARFMLSSTYDESGGECATAGGLMIGRAYVVDLRRFGSATLGLPLADVAARLGVAYVLRVREGYDGPGKLSALEPRDKVVLGGCGEGSRPGVVPMYEWEAWCRGQGYTGNSYGDPTRGYAGCYCIQKEDE